MNTKELSVKMGIKLAWWCNPFVCVVSFFCAPFYLVRKTAPACVVDWASDFVVRHGVTVSVE